ncbi:MAG TPA: protein kinase [Bryobacteraceae bacterium]|nr:protein kinase [Bryobacteraceae bacterium]
MLGCSFSHYRITGKLGEGGMGVVYRAEDTLLHREVAVKFPAPRGHACDERERLFREARAASALVHPNIAAVYDCGECDGSPYVVMELVPGKSLQQVLHDGPVVPETGTAIAIQVAEALSEAHRRGIVHRDIKPSNIIVGERGQVKVLDFGIARRIAPLARGAAAGTEPTTTLEGGISGTPAYMAPDQVRGDPSDPRADLFSLGAVFYECLTGRRAFEGASPFETMARVLEHDPPPPSTVNPAVPHRLDAIVAKILAKEPSRRYGSADDLIADLRAVAPASPGRFRWLRSRPVLASSAVLAFGAILALLWFAWPQSSHRPIAEATRYYEEGVNALADGTYYKAAQALEQAIRIDGAYTLAYAHLADAWNELDYSERAQSAMLKALPPGRDSPRLSRSELLHVQAIHSVLTHDYDHAAALYRQLAGQAAGDAERMRVELDLGRVYEKADRLAAALAVYLSVAGRQKEEPAAHLRAGVVYRRMRDTARAEASLRRAESLYRALSNLEGVTEALYQLSVIANQSSRYADARSLLDQAARMAQASGNEHQQVTVLLQLTGVCSRQGLLDEARQHAADALERAQRHGLDDLVARSLVELGTNAQYRGEAEEAKRRFSDALAVAQRQGGRRTEARARFSLASVRVDLGETAVALADLEPALAFYRAGGYATELSRCAILQGRAWCSQGDYDGARKIAGAELEAGRRTPDPVLEYLALDLIAGIALEQERYREALALHNEAAALSRSKGNLVEEHWALAACGDALWRLGRYDEARHALFDVEAFGKRSKSQAMLAAVEMARAEMALSVLRPDEAERRSRDAVQLAPQDRELAAAAKRIAAVVAARLGETRRAAALADEALTTAQATGNARIVLAAQLARAEAMLVSGDAATAAQIARETEDAASRRGQFESAWRAHVLEQTGLRGAKSAAFRIVGNDPADGLTRLQASMPPEDFKIYMNRPDLRRLLRPASDLIAGKR